MSELRDGLAVAAAFWFNLDVDISGDAAAPRATRSELVTVLKQRLPTEGAPLDGVLSELIEVARPGLMASAGPRYFGFVTGGSIDAALVADVITAGWDQLAFNEMSSPASSAF